MNQETPAQLNVEFTTNDVPEQDIDTLECELEPLENPPKWTKESFSSYRSKLRLMDEIHNAIAETINKKRKASFEAFFRPEDSFVPEPDNNNYYELMVVSLSTK